MRTKKTRYKWNYKKFIHNMIYLFIYAFISYIFGLIILGILGIDFVL